jgi:hypothetical protein
MENNYSITPPPLPTTTTTTATPKPPQPIVFWIIGVSLSLGIVGDCLLRTTPLGINVSMFTGLLCVGLAWGWRRHNESTPCWGLLILVGVLGLCLTWRDASVLRTLNVMTIITLLVVLSTRPARIKLYTGTLASLLTNSLYGTEQALRSPITLLAHDVDWPATKASLNNTHKRILHGLLFSLPILLVFIFLFSAADAVFHHGIENLLMNSHELVMHTIFSLIFFVMITMIIRPITLGEEFKPVHTMPPDTWVPGDIELSVVMGSISLLFLTFILIQFRYLFGGHELVQTLSGLTYATYARKGFFALLAVVILVHLILMCGAWLVESANRRTKIIFRRLSLGLVLLCAFIFASAFFRMSLYIKTYGLTQLRFYATAIMIWLALAFFLSTMKCLFPGWSFFTGAYLYSAVGMLLLINSVNPDGLIARINLSRYAHQDKLDRAYLDELSTDAVPVIMRFQEQLTAEMSDALIKHIIENRHANKTDWRCWNYSRHRAKKLYQSASNQDPSVTSRHVQF